MKLLRSLFAPRQAFRNFALLDYQGRCQALRQSRVPPVGDGWVEIEEIRLNWLHQPLPASAYLSTRATTARVQPILAT
ncbi:MULTISPECIES: hypothetical protein [Pseudomonas]|uniref:Uncharacterized protein n=1 Tax=Pseudomonas sessilinigenes TaxID=658629 RepID=A0ABX8MKE7_9PSED|nr:MULTISPECIES: hypothetical protein [Pseudomonas]AZC26160.1 hypothetical protein C4K39_4513 [Pseudomonas sessilinigenes]QXH39814.1 hypothetical protein KSS89_26920 [Pseudomonas sessilinigenes]UMZ11063.1 hypothetical protein I9018_26860 [Pseudomonas sp. MPFS]